MNERARSERTKENALDKNSPVRVEKPWGYELHWAKTDRYVGKHIHINKGHALSLQYHNKKDETIFLYAGKMLFEIQERRRAGEDRDESRAIASTSRRRPSTA